MLAQFQVSDRGWCVTVIIRLPLRDHRDAWGDAYMYTLLCSSSPAFSATADRADLGDASRASEISNAQCSRHCRCVPHFAHGLTGGAGRCTACSFSSVHGSFSRFLVRRRFWHLAEIGVLRERTKCRCLAAFFHIPSRPFFLFFGFARRSM